MLSTTKIKSTIEPWFGLPTVSTGAAHLALAAAAVAVAFLLALAFANGCLRWISLCIALAQKRICRMQLQGAGSVIRKERRLAAWAYGPWLTSFFVLRRWRFSKVRKRPPPQTFPLRWVLGWKQLWVCCLGYLVAYYPLISIGCQNATVKKSESIEWQPNDDRYMQVYVP